CEGARDRVSFGYDFLGLIVERLSVPRRFADSVRRCVAVLPRLEAGRAGRFTKTALSPTAAEVLALCQAARSDEAAAAPQVRSAELLLLDAKPAKRRRRRRRKGPRP